MQDVQHVPRVVALLVTHGGDGGLPDALAALAGQTHPRIEPIAVDNASSDGTGRRLAELLGPDRVVVADTDLGFAGGVALGLDALAARDAREGIDAAEAARDLVLLLHDDLVLAPDAVARLVDALEADPRVAIVGPKLCWRDRPELLQSVGATIDLTGRVDDGLDPEERDQGQHDDRRRVLFVGSAGMLVRRRVLTELGGLDTRTHAFREDLDLCWRAALADHDVEVVPDAVGLHGALAAEHLRGGSIAELGPRFLAERNTIAALLVNYGPLRLLAVLPLAVGVGIAKTVGFLVTRRLGDARDTTAAWAWNVANLPGTLGRRWRVQRGRRRSDVELAPLFGRVTPRLRAYAEALADRLAGDVPLPGEEVEPEEAPGGPDPGSDAPTGPFARARRAVTTMPARLIGLPLTILMLVGLREVLLPGPLRGGDLAPAPPGPGLVARHLAAWHDTGMTLSPLDPSPVQLVVGLIQWLLPGSGALLPRVLVVLPLLVAWLVSLRVLAGVARAPLARVGLASLLLASPPVLAAAGGGDLQGLAVLALGPPLVLLVRSVVDPTTDVARVWRRVAIAVVLAAALVAAVPPLVVLPPLLALAGVAHAVVVVPPGRWRRILAVRSLVLGLLPLPLLGPWLVAVPGVLTDVVGSAPTVRGGHPLAWLVLVPGGPADPLAGGWLGVALGTLLVGTAIVGAVLRVDGAPRTTAALLAVVLLAPAAAWGLDRVAWDVRPSVLLLGAAGAALVLAGHATTLLPAVLRAHPFGWRQLGTAGLAVALALTATAGLIRHAVEGTPGLTRDPVVPAFIATLGPIPPARVLVIGATADGVRWEVVPVTGPDLAALGTRHEPRTSARIGAAVDDLLALRDPRAAARLGRLGIGAVLVPEGYEDDRLDVALRAQVDLDPLPSVGGRIARVVGAVPVAGVATATASIDRVPDPSTPPRRIDTALAADGAGVLRGGSGPGGDLLVAVPVEAAPVVLVDGVRRAILLDDGSVRVPDLPAGATVEVRLPPRPTRSRALLAQAALVLALVSVGARPPRAALRAAARRAAETDGGSA